MSDDSITPADVRGRSTVHRLVPVDAHRALAVARAIHHPWYRCQSIATVAEHWGTKSEKVALVEEAIRAAHEQGEINRIVTVCRWPLHVLSTLDAERTAQHVAALVTLANREPHTLRRADALFSLTQGLGSLPDVKRSIMPSLAEALLAGRGWRIDRLIEQTCAMVESTYPDTLVRLVKHHGEGAKKQRLIARFIGAG